MALEHAGQRSHIEVRGARVHNLTGFDVAIPLHELVAIAGVSGRKSVVVRERACAEEMFEHGTLTMGTTALHTVHPLAIRIPRGRLTAVIGASGSGKTTMALDSLVPALQATFRHGSLPVHVTSIDPAGITHVHAVDAGPIGFNIRSTVATYSGVHDDLRKAFARTKNAKSRGLKASDFSYNAGSLRCPRCECTGRVELDVQFCPMWTSTARPATGDVIDRRPSTSAARSRAAGVAARTPTPECVPAGADGHDGRGGPCQGRCHLHRRPPLGGPARPRARLPGARRGHPNPLRW